MCKMIKVITNLGTQVSISEYKQKQVEEMIQKAPSCQLIDQIVLFGSVLREDCKDESDIDVVIISKVSVSKLSQSKRYRAYWEKIYKLDDFKTDFDILYFNTYDDIVKQKDEALICKEILEKGQTIYKKDACA